MTIRRTEKAQVHSKEKEFNQLSENNIFIKPVSSGSSGQSQENLSSVFIGYSFSALPNLKRAMIDSE